MQRTARFAALMVGPEPPPLDEGALLIAAHARADLDLRHELARLDALAELCGEPTLDGVHRLLFRDLGFGGNQHRYFDPANSLLDEVLSRRVGIPLTLSVVMIEVGRRLGVPLDGVAMPGHFLVRDRVLPDVFVDPFDEGRVLDLEGARHRFHAVMGARAPFHPDYLEPVDSTVILSRMVANLLSAYQRRGDLVGIGWSSRLRVLCPGVPHDEHVRLARSLASSGQFVMAADLHDEIAEVDGPGGEAHRLAARRLRARLN